jgi:hypothetical protein
MTETKVFISYSHEDELWKEKLFNSLRVLARNKAVRLWDASNLTPGSPAFRKVVTPLNRKPGGLMEQSNASLQRGDQG